MNNTDLISVIIPTYNRAHLIKRSIESVLNQSYKNLELIIVDDGSTDNTKDVIDSIKDERIIYVKQKNQGAAAARNKGIDTAKGEYISFHDSDDICHLDKLEKEIHTLKRNNADVVFGKMFSFGNLIKRIRPENFEEGFLKKDDLPLGVNTGTLFAKKEVFINNKFDITLPSLEDFEIALRIKEKYSIYCINEPLIDYYIQQDSISNKHEKIVQTIEIMLKKDIEILKKYPSSSLDFLSKTLFEEVFKVKDRTRRKRALNLIFTINNSNKTKLIYLFNKIYLYKLRTLMYQTVAKTIKKILLFFKSKKTG
jgi:glycosyltransferase involved in cell wall biosynthesis